MDKDGAPSMTFVAKKHARMARMPILEKRRAAQRIKLLLVQKISELGNTHGAPARAADAIGIDRSLANKLLKGQRMNVALDTVGKVVAKSGVDRDFFLESLSHDPDPHYKNYLRGKYKPGKRSSDSQLGPELDHTMIESTLEEMRATRLERGVFWEAFSRFRWESINTTAVRMFIEGIRGGQSLQRALDNAINAGVDADGKREPGND